MKIWNRLAFISSILILILTISKVQLKEVEVTASYNEELSTLYYNGRTYTLTQQNNFAENTSNLNFLNSLENIETSNSASHALHKPASNLWLTISIIAFLTLFAGAMSGLTIGYLSIDDLVLELKSKTGTDSEQHYASKILPIINKRHWLLVTLLLFNATAMEALPIFLNRIVDEFYAILISVSLVLFVGEIIPQALCTGPSQSKIAAFFAPVTSFLMYISIPVSYPIALLLDYLVGKHSKSRFVNTDLKSLIELHTHEALAKLRKEEEGHSSLNCKAAGKHIGLHNEQADLMISALEIKERKASEIMISLDNVYMIDYEQNLDKVQIGKILDKGYSRIPVYNKDKDNLLGILRMKQLIGIDIGFNKTLKMLNLKLSAPLVVHPNTPALDLLREFRKGRSHMAFVTPNIEEYQKRFEEGNLNDSQKVYSILSRSKSKVGSGKILGMVTLEDVLEKMINIEIFDEDDYARNKVLHEKSGTVAKNKFYKDAITKELAKSFMEEKLNSIYDSSFQQKNLLLEKGDYYDYDPSLKLKEPLL